MAFHTHHSHGATGYMGTRAPSKPATGCACGCGDPAPKQASALTTAARMVVSHKVDQALERAAPLHTQAKGGAPLRPRGVLDGKAHGGTERPTQRRVAAQGPGTAKAAKQPTAAAPLRPRGILSGRA